MHFGVQTNKK